MLSTAASWSSFPPHPQTAPGEKGFSVMFLPSLEAVDLPTAMATRPFAGAALNSHDQLRRGSATPSFHVEGGHRSPCHAQRCHQCQAPALFQEN